jgi:hypothetical protein
VLSRSLDDRMRLLRSHLSFKRRPDDAGRRRLRKLGCFLCLFTRRVHPRRLPSHEVFRAGLAEPGLTRCDLQPHFALRHDDAVHLEHLGVLAVHVDPVRPGDVADVLGIAVAPVLLRLVLRERRDLLLDVRLL